MPCICRLSSDLDVSAGKWVLAANPLQMQPDAVAAWRCRDLGKCRIRDHIGRTRFRSTAMNSLAPHHPSLDLWDNPMGTDGFEFVEYTGPDPAQLAALFGQMGFVAAARHRSKKVTLYKQGDVNFI